MAPAKRARTGRCSAFLATSLLLNTADCHAADSIEAWLLPASRFYSCVEPSPPTVRVAVRNTTDAAYDAQAEVRIGVPGRQDFSATTSLRLLPHTTTNAALTLLACPPYGVHHVSVRVMSKDGTVTPWTRDLIAVYAKNSPLSAGSLVFSVGFATGASRCTPRLLSLAATLGFEFHRFEPRWGNVQPKEGEWQWEELDAYVSLIESFGMRPQPLLMGSPRWAAKNRTLPPRPDAWNTYVAALAKRYRGRMAFWEVWNEPDIGFFDGTVEDYIAMQREAYGAIKSAAPHEIVTSAGFASLNHGRVKPGIYEAALREYPHAYDWFAYHQHGAFPEFYTAVALQLPAVQRQLGVTHVPLVFTETGMDTRFGQRFQASTLAKKLTYAAAIPAKGYVLYNLMDRAGGAESNKAGQTYGLLTNPTGTGRFSEIEEDLRPKESFVAVAAALRELRNRPPLSAWRQDGHVFAYLFGQPKNYLLVGWCEGRDHSTATWEASCANATIEQVDLFGNASPVKTSGGHFRFQLGSDPVYMRFRGDEKPPAPIGEPVPKDSSSQTVSVAQGERLILGKLAQVTNFFEHDPHSLDRLWGGPSDLSAVVSFSCDASTGALMLNAAVTDDKHHPSAPQEPLRFGDALHLEWGKKDGTSFRQTIADTLGKPPRTETSPDTLNNKSALRSVAIDRTGMCTTYRIAFDTNVLNPTAEGLLPLAITVDDNDGQGSECRISEEALVRIR